MVKTKDEKGTENNRKEEITCGDKEKRTKDRTMLMIGEQTVSQVFERRSQASVERQKSFEEEWKHRIMDFSKRLMVYERKRKG